MLQNALINLHLQLSKLLAIPGTFLVLWLVSVLIGAAFLCPLRVCDGYGYACHFPQPPLPTPDAQGAQRGGGRGEGHREHREGKGGVGGWGREHREGQGWGEHRKDREQALQAWPRHAAPSRILKREKSCERQFSDELFFLLVSTVLLFGGAIVQEEYAEALKELGYALEEVVCGPLPPSLEPPIPPFLHFSTRRAIKEAVFLVHPLQSEGESQRLPVP